MEATRRRRPYTARAIREIAAAAGVLWVASGCGSSQSTLSPDSHASHTIATLWWVMFVGSAVIFAGVVALLLVGVLRRRGEDAPRKGSPGQRFVAVLGLIVPAVILVLSLTTHAARQLASLTNHWNQTTRTQELHTLNTEATTTKHLSQALLG